MTFDITDPYAPVYVDYINTRDFAITPAAAYPADLGPEGLLFISASESPNGKNLLLVSNEISGSISIYETDYACGNLLVSVCNNGVTECINQTQLASYLASGATLGECQSTLRNQIEANQISIAPNPANDFINIRLLGEGSNGCEIMIADLSGRIVQRMTHVDLSMNQNLMMDATSLAPGFYHVSVFNLDGLIAKTKISIVR